MSAAVEPSEGYEHSVDPENLKRELVRFLTTSINYVMRQGLSEDDVRRTIEIAFFARQAVPKATVLPVPELLDKGINDMREKGAN